MVERIYLHPQHQDISLSSRSPSPSTASIRWIHVEAEAFQHLHWQQNSHSKDNRILARPEKFNTHIKSNNIRIAVVTASIRPTSPGPKGAVRVSCIPAKATELQQTISKALPSPANKTDSIPKRFSRQQQLPTKLHQFG
ncbi:hypothetical protein Nepgr_017443 [Nepenthes gracilis]|uniref:Uncharacterized protein n=1 Tax=Nepenthes gracilis TaxID=150966 RepID=A0AAD3SSD8_NEPGR|nr:hypothetical protein Nepgr_017443 [Nepenthes gracilis]